MHSLRARWVRDQLLVTDLVLAAHQQVTVTLPVRMGLLPPGTVVTNVALASSPKLYTAARAEQTFTVPGVFLPLVFRGY